MYVRTEKRTREEAAQTPAPPSIARGADALSDPLQGATLGSDQLNPRSLDAGVRTDMERSFGRSFADVRVHDDPLANRQTDALGARAVTVGRDISFGSGQYDADTAHGRELIAHELAHYAQTGGVAGDVTGMSHPSQAHEQRASEAASAATRGAPVGDVGSAPALVHAEYEAITPDKETKKGTKRRLDIEKGTTREESALRALRKYALDMPVGPVSFAPDPTFGERLLKTVNQLADEMQASASYDQLPARLKAIVFAVEQLNPAPFEGAKTEKDQSWMYDGVSPGRDGSVSKYGAGTWKCNKLVLDSYGSKEGAGLGRDQMPIAEGGGYWGPQANELAGDQTKLKGKGTMPHSWKAELSASEGQKSTVKSYTEYDPTGKVVARFVGQADGKFQKTVDGKPVGTAMTEAEIQPERGPKLGDVVAFQNIHRAAKPRPVSGHTGLNLGNDLFISAMNTMHGVGIASISMHLDARDGWDTYDQVAFRRHTADSP